MHEFGFSTTINGHLLMRSHVVILAGSCDRQGGLRMHQAKTEAREEAV